MVDWIPQKRILRLEINGNPVVYIDDPTFEIRARAACGTSSRNTRGNSRSNKSWTFIKWVIPLKDILTCSSTDIYHMCRTRHFRWKGQCATEIQLLNTPRDRRGCHGRQAMTPLWCRSINTLCFPQKLEHFHDRGWGRQRYLPPRLRGDMTTPTAIALVSSFDLLLISRILVDTNRNGRYHVIIGINHGKVCIVDTNSLVCCFATGRHSGFDVNNTTYPWLIP